MNLFLKSYNKCLIFFLFITVHVPVLSRHSTDSLLHFIPRIQEIKTTIHQDNLPYQSLYVDNNGIIYLGKENSLLIISGSSVHRFSLKGRVYISGNNKDSVFYVCSNDLGLIRTAPDLKFELKSLRSQYEQLQDVFQPSGLYYIDNFLFIPYEREVLVFSGNKVYTEKFDHIISSVLASDNDFFIITRNQELKHWRGNKFENLNLALPSPDQEIVSIYKKQDTLSVITSEGVKYHFLPGTNAYRQSGKDRVSKPGLRAINNPYTHNQYTIVEGYGLSLFDPCNQAQFHIGPEIGFTFNDLVCCMEDRYANLYILLNHAVYKMDNTDLFSWLDLQYQYRGRINSMITVGSSVYLAGNAGLAVINDVSGNKALRLEHIPGTEKENYSLLDSYGEHVFAAGSDRLLELSDSGTKIIDRGQVYNMLVLSSDSLLVAGKEGLLFYKRNAADEKWLPYTIDPSFHSIQSMCYFKHSVWFITGENQLVRLHDGFSFSIPEIIFQSSSPLSLHLQEDNLFLFSGDSIFILQDKGPEPHSLDLPAEVCLLHAHQGWVSSCDTTRWYTTRMEDRQAVWSLLYRDGEFYSRVLPMASEIGDIKGIGTIASCMWIADQDRIYRINRKALPPEDFRNPSLKISFYNESFLYKVYTSDLPGESSQPEAPVRIRYRNRNFTLSFLPEDTQSGNTYFIRYRILPKEPEWGNWTSRESIQTEGLRPGAYALEIERINQFGQHYPVLRFPFQIRVPIFRHWIAYIFYFILAIILVFLINKWRMFNIHKIETKAEEKVQYQINELVKEKEKSDKLVADMFPKTTADELKSSGRAKWDKYEMATVLFSDIQGFTKIAEHMNPELLIDELDKFFFHFDSVVDKYNIEKIKTIGDAYMAAGGIPEKNSTNPVEVVLAALEMQHYMLELKKSNSDIWDLRIGIHTGPVIAGVVGHKKLSYDIWGDTVNTASRMESSGIAGKVNISGTTYSLVKDYFICEYRGKLPVKYKGNIDMYFVTGLRPELTIDLAGLPNKRFGILLQTLRLNDLELKMFESYYKEFDSRFRFHTTTYIRKFLDHIRLLCRAEELDEEDTLICLSSGMMLYSGLSQAYENFENRSVVIARDLLPLFQFSDRQIDIISNTILGTKLPYDPRNILEKILIDARMDYLGRPDFNDIIRQLYLEAVENGILTDFNEWKGKQAAILKEFSFYTLASKRLKEVPVEEQLKALNREN